MAIRRGEAGVGVLRNRTNGSCFPIAVLIFLAFLVFSSFVFGRGLSSSASSDINDSVTSFNKQDLNWRERLALQHVKSLFSKEGMDVIKANMDDLGPLSLESFRKNNLSASWKLVGPQTVADTNVVSAKSTEEAANDKQETSKGKQEDILDGDLGRLV